MSIDRGFGADTCTILAKQPLETTGRERTHLKIEKWDEDQARWAYGKLEIPVDAIVLKPRHFAAVKCSPYGIHEYEGNLITTAGWNQLFVGGIFGTTPTKFSTTVGRIGVGTSTTAATATDTALGSVTSMTGNNWILCGANPTLSTAATPCTAVFTATFGATAAVGAWNEFAIDQGTASAGPVVTATAPMINHSANIGAGTKAGGTWTATATLSFT